MQELTINLELRFRCNRISANGWPATIHSDVEPALGFLSILRATVEKDVVRRPVSRTSAPVGGFQ